MQDTPITTRPRNLAMATFQVVIAALVLGQCFACTATPGPDGLSPDDGEAGAVHGTCDMVVHAVSPATTSGLENRHGASLEAPDRHHHLASTVRVRTEHPPLPRLAVAPKTSPPLQIQHT